MRKRRGTTVGPRGSGGLRATAARRGPACRRDRQRSGRRGRGATLEVRAAEVVAPFPPMTNRPVCERHGPTGEPVAGKPHGGFGERGEETWPWWRLRHRHEGESRRQQRFPPTYRRRASPRLYTERLIKAAYSAISIVTSITYKAEGTRPYDRRVYQNKAQISGPGRTGRRGPVRRRRDHLRRRWCPLARRRGQSPSLLVLANGNIRSQSRVEAGPEPIPVRIHLPLLQNIVADPVSARRPPEIWFPGCGRPLVTKLTALRPITNWETESPI